MRVRFTRRAQRDLHQIYNFISQDNPTIASRFVARLIERARKIGDHPMGERQTTPVYA
jgi:plasmid stabilization system protein ParE